MSRSRVHFAVFTLILLSLFVILPSGIASATPTCRSEGYGPNYYTLGYQATYSYYGIQATITTSLPSVPHEDGYFSNEALHISNAEDFYGLEVGWYVGWGSETGTYVTAPHAYATDEDTEVDGPDVYGVGNTSTNYWYSTWWTGSTDNYRVDASVDGTVLWSGTISTPGDVEGSGDATGEVPSNTLPIGPSTLAQLQQLNANGTWTYWTGMSLCADTPYSVTENSGDSVSNS